ncbi:ret finger protein-like 4A [Callorhinus ursinus]|uniref:Ret finger protein-like 4A n=1 Tax=Callorhinus ursinus TaxID=34884 RepID=A0A3Q7MDI7_CALUR|nr:ret finger protein-like 4A [Callorhinus ursinus]XP_025704892.1 ret finger protein-like 4A [Callorhinus ursinus]
MAERFKERSGCPVCLTHLETPMYLQCGFVCCLRCIDSLQKEPRGEGLLCPSCSVVSQKKDLRLGTHLGRLVSRIKELEPQLTAVLQMNPKMRKFQVEVTLDVDTANHYLIVSEDLRSVCCGYSKQNRRARAERFNYALCVLGSPRFPSGRHYWEVDVGSSKEWDVGVCRDAANRQGPILLSAELGFWTVGLRKGDLFQASTMPVTVLSVSPRLHRLGIFLDMNFGTISFYHISDGSHIFTFTEIPAVETLRPFFALSDPITDGQGFLRICPVMNPAPVASDTEQSF